MLFPMAASAGLAGVLATAALGQVLRDAPSGGRGLWMRLEQRPNLRGPGHSGAGLWGLEAMPLGDASHA